MSVDLTRLPEALKDHGVQVIEFGEWRKRGYDTVDFIGQLNHHTAISGPISPSTAGAMVRGRPDLPGPLCNAHGGLDDKGHFILYLVAALRARHAGPGATQVYNEFLRDVHVERTAGQRGLVDDTNAHGNRSLFGWEWQHPGDASAWTGAMLEGMGRCNAALAQIAGWSPNRSKGHKHWTRRKIDPSWPGSLPDLTARYLEEDVPLTETEMAQIAAKVVEKLEPVILRQTQFLAGKANAVFNQTSVGMPPPDHTQEPSGTPGAAPTYEAQITLTPKTG